MQYSGNWYTICAYTVELFQWSREIESYTIDAYQSRCNKFPAKLTLCQRWARHIPYTWPLKQVNMLPFDFK